jgi:hypothetical protein
VTLTYIKRHILPLRVILDRGAAVFRRRLRLRRFGAGLRVRAIGAGSGGGLSRAAPRCPPALIDTDWQTLIWHVADVHLGARVATAWEGHLAHNHLPRRLKPLLSSAGFQVERVEPIIILNIYYTPSAFSFMLLQIVADYVRGTGQLSNAEVEAWVADGSKFSEITALPTGYCGLMALLET